LGALHPDHLVEHVLRPGRLLATQMALGALRTQQLAGTGDLKTLGRSLMRFDLVLLTHSLSPLLEQVVCSLASKGRTPEASDHNQTVILVHRRLLGLSGRRRKVYSASFAGARTISMVRPSIAGRCSTSATSSSSLIIRSICSRAISGYVISRPRNRTLTLTLLPSSSQRRASRILNERW